MKAILMAVAALWLGVSQASAAQIRFDDGWTEQTFALFSRNQYRFGGDRMEVSSDGTVSLVWTALPMAQWQGRRATWDWAVDRSVPASDLTRKGGDDRNLSLYFVFLPDDAARRARGDTIRSLLRNNDVRVLVYVWGGGHRRGDVLPSPYLGARGKTLILRASGTGREVESVDLGRDYARAFGQPARNLVGLAVSADSDDTDSSIRAAIGNLRIE